MPARGSISFWVFILILVVLHFTLHIAVGLDTTAPDLLTVAVLLGARRLSGARAAALGLALGVLVDALSLTKFGAHALTLTIVGFLGARSRDLFEGDSLFFAGMYIFVGKWVNDAVYFVLTRSAQADSLGALVTSAPIAAAYAAFAAMVALTLYRAATGER